MSVIWYAIETDKKPTSPRKKVDATRNPKDSVPMQWLSKMFPASWTRSEKAQEHGRTMLGTKRTNHDHKY